MEKGAKHGLTCPLPGSPAVTLTMVVMLVAFMAALLLHIALFTDTRGGGR